MSLRKEIKVHFSKSEQAYQIKYLLHGDKATMQFVVRCPTPDWNYYLAIDLGFHADSPTYNQEAMDCDIRPIGKCYYDGTSLGAEELWKEFRQSGDENVIWNKLEEWQVSRFDAQPTIKESSERTTKNPTIQT